MVVSRHQGDIGYDFRGGGYTSQRQGFLQTGCDERYVLVRTCNTTIYYFKKRFYPSPLQKQNKNELTFLILDQENDG
jgi:hypothetical protein